jgi:SsrA-binding protein
MEYLRNKKASFDYQFLETYECGVELLGTEVKSVRAGHGSLSGSYVTVFGGDLVLMGAHIPAWQEKNTDHGFDPYRTRKLLVHRKELAELKIAADTKGLTLVPISMYSKNRLIKLQIAVAKGKKLFDKRESIKESDLDRELRQQQRRNEL